MPNNKKKIKCKKKINIANIKLNQLKLRILKKYKSLSEFTHYYVQLYPLLSFATAKESMILNMLHVDESLTIVLSIGSRFTKFCYFKITGDFLHVSKKA